MSELVAAHTPIMPFDDYDQRWGDTLGDHGPWIRHVPAAWTACARHDGAPVDIPARVQHDPLTLSEADTLFDAVAYWAAPLQLLIYGLGWTRPDLGLHRWVQEGMPAEEPVLWIVMQWWGKDGVYWFLEWAHVKGGLEVPIRQVPSQPWHLMTVASDGRRASHPADVLRTPTGGQRNPFGLDGDYMHLTDHLSGPLIAPRSRLLRVTEQISTTTNPNQVSRRVIVTDTYAGWYAGLLAQQPARSVNGRSVLTDVVVTPIGWLGEYRRHDATGLWFRGRSSVHLWGN